MNMWQLLSMVYAHIHHHGFLESYTMWDHHGEKHVASYLGYYSTPRINTLTTTEVFDVIDDVMVEQNTNGENANEEGRGIGPKFDALFKELNTEL